ncbi:ATP-binding cassette domain-containing protein [Acidimicrobiia bacterium EGI L10123]|uniref:ABC transporter ATP-binding protein n=1 Tax=Salinilacustrithrix flava TaxID=2957203 RepID=UPI003D7C2BF4|nr:ATP-binding cassette domain-containing protein [Acidimicrobiia bacterium EGI L10123]
MSASSVEVRDLVIEYASGGYAVRPIDGLDLDAAPGELVVLLGPSGCGKTSLLSVLGGILRPTSGSVRVGGVAVESLRGAALAEYRKQTVGFVFQAFNLIPSLNARENVAMPLLMAGVKRSRALERADRLLDRVGLADRARHKPSKLSGGQQQRVAVARGLAADPAVLLADEPTANLDYIQAEGIISLLRDLRADGRSIVVSSHDDRLVPIADRVVHLVPEFREDEQPPHLEEFAAGSVVFEQGARGELVYVIRSGTVEIIRQLADGGVEQLATLGPDDYFGELGPLLGFPRSATARAVSDLQLMAYSVQDFREQVLGSARAASNGHTKPVPVVPS